jgi:Transposase IS66 family
LERYLSPEGMIESKLPPGFEGSEFGPELRAFIHMLYFQARVPYNKIESILKGMGVEISDSEICRLVNRENAELKEEHEKARVAGIKKADFVQVDDTGARIMNESAHTIVTSNPYFCHYFTSESKDRMSVLKALQGDRTIFFLVNNTSLSILKGKISKNILKQLKRLKKKKQDLLTHAELHKKLRAVENIPLPALHEIETACAMAAYRAQVEHRPLILVSDDAKNFKRIFRYHQLCWIHEMRHYRVIHAFCDFHEKLLNDQLDQMSKLYKRIKKYQANPDPEEKKKIEAKFDEIFERETPMNALNEQFALTMARKKGLLIALDYPHIVIQNNESETDLRERVLKRMISHGNQSWEGVKSWDLHLSLVHTTRKLGVSYWEFLKDRFQRKYEIPRLDRIIRNAPPRALRVAA